MKIGLASFAHVHAAGYAALLNDRPDVELLAADPGADPGDATRGAGLADQLGVRLVGSYEDLLTENLDGIVVCSENSRHRPIVELAAQAGVHVLCEKPIATRLPDARAMIDACRTAGVALMIAYPVRFSPHFQRLKDTVAAGEIGPVLACTGTNNGQIPIDARAWFVDPELAGGGSLMDHTVHVADLLLDLLPAAPESVYAQTNTILHADRVEVETGGLVLLDYPDGTVATIDCSWSRPATYPTWGGVTLEVAGTEGTISTDIFGAALRGWGRDGELWRGDGTDLDALLLERFLQVARGERAAEPDGEIGYTTLQIVTAAYESVRTGRPVRMADVS